MCDCEEVLLKHSESTTQPKSIGSTLHIYAYMHTVSSPLIVPGIGGKQYAKFANADVIDHAH
jgi:hypothetical protein